MQNPPRKSRRFEPDPSLPSPALRLRGVAPTSFRSSRAAMAGAKQPRRYRLPAILPAVVAAALLLFSPAVGALEKGTNRSSLLGQPRQWSTGKDERGDPRRGGSPRQRQSRRGLGGWGTRGRVRIPRQHAAVGDWYSLGLQWFLILLAKKGFLIRVISPI